MGLFSKKSEVDPEIQETETEIQVLSSQLNEIRKQIRESESSLQETEKDLAERQLSNERELNLWQQKKQDEFLKKQTQWVDSFNQRKIDGEGEIKRLDAEIAGKLARLEYLSEYVKKSEHLHEMHAISWKRILEGKDAEITTIRNSYETIIELKNSTIEDKNNEIRRLESLLHLLKDSNVAS